MIKTKEMKSSTKAVSVHNLAFIGDNKDVQTGIIKDYRNSDTDNITLNKKNSNNSQLNNACIESYKEIKDHLKDNHLKETSVSRFNKDKVIEKEKIIFKNTLSIKNEIDDCDILSEMKIIKRVKLII